MKNPDITECQPRATRWTTTTARSRGLTWTRAGSGSRTGPGPTSTGDWEGSAKTSRGPLRSGDQPLPRPSNSSRCSTPGQPAPCPSSPTRTGGRKSSSPSRPGRCPGPPGLSPPPGPRPGPSPLLLSSHLTRAGSRRTLPQCRRCPPRPPGLPRRLRGGRRQCRPPGRRLRELSNRPGTKLNAISNSNNCSNVRFDLHNSLCRKSSSLRSRNPILHIRICNSG